MLRLGLVLAFASAASASAAAEDPAAFVARNNPDAQVEIVDTPAASGAGLAELAFGGGVGQALRVRRIGLGALQGLNWTGSTFAAGPNEAVTRNAAFDLSPGRMTGVVYAPDGKTQVFLPLGDGRLLKVSEPANEAAEAGDPLTCKPDLGRPSRFSKSRPQGFFEACPKTPDAKQPVSDISVLVALDAGTRAYFAELTKLTGVNQEKAFVDRLFAGANLSFLNSGVRMAFRAAGEPVSLTYEYAKPGAVTEIETHAQLLEHLGQPNAAKPEDKEFAKLRDIRIARKADLVAVIVGRKDRPDPLSAKEAETLKRELLRNPDMTPEDLQQRLRMRPYSTPSREGCGQALELDAKADYAIAVIARGCAEAKFTFVHELGHLMGAQHACDGNGGLAPYGHGAHFRDAKGNLFRTVMAKCEGPGQMSEDLGGFCPPRMPVWSQSPRPGQSVAYGTPDRDNARLLNCVAADVARNGETLGAPVAASAPITPVAD